MSLLNVKVAQVEEAIATLERIKADLPTIYELDRRLAEVETFDGFRASVRPMEGSAGTVLDEDGYPIPPLSDPTGNGVVAMLDGTRKRSSVRDELLVLNGALSEVLGHVRQAHGAMARAMVPPGELLNPDACVVHLRHGFGFEPVYRCRSCRWCYQFSLAEGVDPPYALLDARSRGQRITERMVADALRHQPKAKSRKRGRKAG